MGHLLQLQVFPLAQTGMLLQTSLKHQSEELGLFALIFQESRIHTVRIRGRAGSLHNSANGHRGKWASSPGPRLVPHNFRPHPGKCTGRWVSWGVFSRQQGHMGKIPKIRLGTCPARVLPRRTGMSSSRGKWRRSGCHLWEAEVPLLLRGKNIAYSHLSSSLRVWLICWEENNIYIFIFIFICVQGRIAMQAPWSHCFPVACGERRSLGAAAGLVLCAVSPPPGENLEYFHPTESKCEGEEGLHWRVQRFCVLQ